MVFAVANIKRRKRLTPEADLQRAVCDYLECALPRDAVFFAVPNGGTRNVIEAANLKRQGVVPGVPDLIVLWNTKAFAVELKSEKGSRTEMQRRFHDRLHDARIPVITARTVLEVENFLRDHSFPLRAAIAA